MDDEAQKREQTKAQEQLDHSSARLETLQDEAQRLGVDGVKAEVGSLNVLRDRLDEQLQSFPRTDASSLERLRDSLKEGMALLSERTDMAAEHLSGYHALDDDGRLDTEVDQVASAVEIILMRLDEADRDDADLGPAVQDELRAAMQDVTDVQGQLAAAVNYDKSELRDRLRAALDTTKEQVECIVAKLTSRRESPAEERA